MSRAGEILYWVQTVDEGDPIAFSTDYHPGVQLSQGTGYTYQDRGQKDRQGNSRLNDGTKPSGMIVNNDSVAQGHTTNQMSPEDVHMMDVRPV